MTLPISGQSEAEVRVLIAESNDRQAQMIDQKLSAHQEVMERRLSATDASVRDNLDRLIDLKSDVAVLVTTDGHQTVLLEKLVENGDAWHASDLEYRSSMVKRISAIEVEQVRLTGEVNIIRWFVAGSAGITKVLAVSVRVIGMSKFWQLVATGVLMVLMEKLSPHLYSLIKQYLYQ